MATRQAFSFGREAQQLPAHLRRFMRPFALALAIASLANILFLTLVRVAPDTPELIARRARTAFQTGELGQVDYLPFDSRRGWHQYNDCNVLQMLSNPGGSRLQRALAPTIYKADEEFNYACPVLSALIVDDLDRTTLYSFRYARYWHGYKVLTAFGLQIMELRELRMALSVAVWIAIGTLALAACRAGRHMRLAALIIAAAAATLWAVPFFAPSLTHGPGDALLLLGLAVVAAWPRIVRETRTLVPYATAFGAVSVFFEMLTGQLPIAAAWLAVLLLAAYRDEASPGEGSPTVHVVVALCAFGIGAAMSVIVKQLLAATFAEPSAGAQFFTQLRSYTSVPSSSSVWPGILLPFARLARSTPMLTFGNVWAAYSLLAVTGALWLFAAASWWRNRGRADGRDRLLLLLATMVPFVWVLLLPRHTYIHAPFMARILIVPISLAPLAVFWPRGGVMRVEEQRDALADR
jgi:hypothetical protein